ncbi:MAG: chromosome segregation protein SMC [Chloroflexi bacterium]|nr:chromosome segregation protein SMC [Chloroflexota bacterium]
MPLRLKSLELQGYKTFAARTEFQFSGGITAIVGPNGSGKSNIADSLRWVLGEQSYSLLRAKRTEDMIFAGSEQRTRAGMASATVVFDNSNGWLPVDFTEVALSRRAYRDGRNEYLLNGQHVRLRDIYELLAQSGLSERTYTILGQGLVDASLALKADERRRLFEEAAGVGLYRSRREEALRRLETTLRNLERVKDILSELEPRLRSLERQARRAQEFAQAQADLRLLLRDLYGYHWHHAQKELTEGRELLRQQEGRTHEARQASQSAQGEYLGFREHLQGLRARLNAWHRESAQLHTSRETISRDLAVLEERQRSLAQARLETASEQARLEDELAQAQGRLAEASAGEESLQAEYEEARLEAGQARQALQARQAERAGVEQSLQAERQSYEAQSNRRAELSARLDELTTRLDGYRSRLGTFETAIAGAGKAAAKADSALRQAQAAHAKTAKAHRRADEDLQEARQSLADLEQEQRLKAEQRAGQDAQRTRVIAQLEVLDQAETTLSGYAEGARTLLEAARQSRLKTHGALGALLDIPAELETAISAALGEALDAVVLASGEETEAALRLLENEDSGRAVLLPIHSLACPVPVACGDADCLGVASDLVQAAPGIRPALDLLLGQTLVARDRAAARRLLGGQPQTARVVTLRGEVFRADGAILAGKPPRSGSLGRPRQRRELQSALETAEDRLAALDSGLQQLGRSLEDARRMVGQREAVLHKARLEMEQAAAAEQQASLQSESARRNEEWQKAQRQALQAEIDQAGDETRQAGEARSLAEGNARAAAEHVRELDIRLAALTLEETQEQVAYWSTRVAVAGRAIEDARTRQAERQQALQRLEIGRADQVRRQQEAEQTLSASETRKAELHSQEGTFQEELAALQAQIEPAESELEAAEKQEEQLQERESAAQRALAAAERLHAQYQMDLTRRQETLDNLRQKVEDDFGLVQFNYAADVQGPVPLPFDGMVEQLAALTELPPNLEEQVTQQRAMLRRMGPVNPEARQEFDSETERHHFLVGQVADLHKAEADLREVIAELDGLTQREFRKTFEAVAHEFREIFVRLFGGGSARLVLTDPDNLVETGIDIEARLPGRREQGLALLSGGERSLTAIALVFALLRVSPTPVCVMDEVDAMLDEANVGRFREMLLDLSRDTQFIIVTHNRNTVQVADIIYGVTMGRDSASQIISLRLDEVSDQVLGNR